MRRAAGGSNRFLRMAESPIGKALIPQDLGQHSMASRASVEPVTGALGAVALGIVQRQAFFEVPARPSEVA